VRLFVFLHVLSMIVAVGISGGAEILVHRVAATGELAAVRNVLATYGKIANFIAPTFVLGAIFGAIAIFTEGFDPFQPWLVTAYVLFVAGVLVGNFMNGGWASRLAATSSVATIDEDPAYRAALADPIGRRGLVLFWILIAALVFVMIVKPLS
jgi:hypothetical protein